MSEKLLLNKKNPESEDEAGEMSFWDHLEVLRWHITRSLIAVLVLGVIAFLNRSFVFDVIILAPKSTDFISNVWLCKLSEMLNNDFMCMKDSNLQLINVQLSGQFLTHMYISLMFGLIAAVPYIFWEIWRFVKPALYETEKRYSGFAVVITSVLFLLGVLFSYFLIVPLAVYFLGNYTVSETVSNTVTLSSYINTVLTLSFALGIVFELPVIMYFLSKVGFVSVDYLKRNRKYMIVIALVLAAIITPADPFSQIMVAIPLILLYEISVKVVGRVEKKTATKE